MVVDEVQLAIKELPLKTVFAPSPVGVDPGQSFSWSSPSVRIIWWSLATSISQVKPVFFTRLG